MRRGIRAGGLVIALTVGLLLAGCGGDDEPDEDATPEETATAFFTAIEDQDADAFCAAITTSAQQAAAEEEDVETCEESVEKGFASGDADEALAQATDVEVGEATIEGETATVTATSSEGEEGEVPLVQEDGVWKVDVE